MIGKVIKYDVKDINTDLIIPARYLVNSDSEYLAKHCMEDLDTNFIEKKNKFDYSVLVAGANFGCGSSREQAPIALKSAGMKCIIAPSFARIFFRNAINIGLPIVELQNIKAITTGDDLEIIFTKGIVKNLSKSIELIFNKIPSFIGEIISADGLVNFARHLILENEEENISQTSF
ncbi:MAG: 3-isopropylmalate dehydratase small subunit [Promethearchaeota archaeon]